MRYRELGRTGVSMTFLKAADDHGLPRIASIQNAYSLVNRTSEIGFSEIAQREEVSLLGYSPLGQGYLTSKYEDGALRPGSARSCSTVSGVMRKETGPRRSRPMSRSRGSIIGATTFEQLKTDIAAVDLEVSDNLLEDINQIHLDYSNLRP